ncbi:MAG: hypothetical protein AAGA75_13705 [Cyanobacteria bacterium P01_E01_bin.6]
MPRTSTKARVRDVESAMPGVFILMAIGLRCLMLVVGIAHPTACG